MTPAGLVVLLCLCSTPTVVLTGDAMGEETYSLKGRVMDTSDNWLPDEEFAKTWQRYGNTEPSR